MEGEGYSETREGLRYMSATVTPYSHVDRG